MEIELPDGTVLDAPDNADVKKVVQGYYARTKVPPKPDAFAGDDLLSNEAMQKLSAGAQSTVTPTQDRSGIAKYLSSVRSAFTEPVQQTSVDKIPLVGQLAGIGEAGLSMATGVLDPITAPLFAGGEVGGGTYQPRTGSGKALMNVMGAVTAPVAESGNALLPLAPELQSLSLRRVPKAPAETPKPIPTTAALKKAKNEAYALAKETDVSVPAADYSTALGKIRNVVTDEGIDPTLHPKSTAVMRRLDAAEGQPLSLQQAETLRKIALDAEDDLNPVTRAPTPDARIAGKIVDELDDQIDALSLNSEARALNARYRRSDMIDRMIKRAEIRAGANYTQAGMEHALRQEFKTLALNDRRMRFFTPTQREAIEKVAKGGAMENSLRAIGKFDPTTGGMAAFMGGTLGTLAGGPMGLAIPAAGFVGKRLATRMTAGNVAKAREALVGRGLLATETPARGLLSEGASPLPKVAPVAAARPVAEIRRDLQALDEQLKRLPAGAAQDSPAAQQLRAAWERLRAELSAAESATGSP